MKHLATVATRLRIHRSPSTDFSITTSNPTINAVALLQPLVHSYFIAASPARVPSTLTQSYYNQHKVHCDCFVNIRLKSTLAVKRKRLSSQDVHWPITESSNLFIQKRQLHTKTKDGKGDDKTYTNKAGEQIIYDQRHAPPGYKFLQSGNAFITRRSRELTQKLYVVYSNPKSRKKRARQIGICVPSHVRVEARSEFAAKRTKLSEDLRLSIEEEYPSIPPTDMEKLLHDILSDHLTITGMSALTSVQVSAFEYVRNRYTPFRDLELCSHGQDRKSRGIPGALKTYRGILASWLKKPDANADIRDLVLCFHGEDQNSRRISEALRGIRRTLASWGEKPVVG